MFKKVNSVKYLRRKEYMPLCQQKCNLSLRDRLNKLLLYMPLALPVGPIFYSIPITSHFYLSSEKSDGWELNWLKSLN